MNFIILSNITNDNHDPVRNSRKFEDHQQNNICKQLKCKFHQHTNQYDVLSITISLLQIISLNFITFVIITTAFKGQLCNWQRCKTYIHNGKSPKHQSDLIESSNKEINQPYETCMYFRQQTLIR